MKKLKFEKGEFITQDRYPAKSFAIFEGLPYDKANQDDPDDFSLICYYNPLHYTQDSNGNLKSEPVFEYDYDDNNEFQECSYSIEENDFGFWRTCSDDEKASALKFLAETKRLAFDEKTFKFRKLGVNERIIFDTPRSTGQCGGNVNHNRGTNTNPYYGRGTNINSKKYISRIVKDDWEQKIPVETMSIERRTLIEFECNRIGMTSSTEYYCGARRYPTNGSEIPYRYPAEMGYDGYGWDGYDD